MLVAPRIGAAVRISFGPFVLDLESRVLMSGDREIHLAPKAFELLAALLQDRPKVLSKARLREQLWADTVVVGANLSNLIAELREALGDDARQPRFIRTVHGFGYAFCGDASSQPNRPRPGEETRYWLECGTRRFVLAPGMNVVGRDPDVEMVLDAPTVSRRHARFVATAEGTTLEDMGSKNGTFRGGERITSPIRLADGDAIHIGSILVTFHVRRPSGLADTQTVAE